MCPFCDKEIIAKQRIFETGTEYVLYNIRRSNKGRIMVVPKRHVVSLDELSDEEIASFFNTVKFCTKKLKKYLRPDGINFGHNEGEVAGQTVSHFHFHILPRFIGDGLPEFHLFHGDPEIKTNLKNDEVKKMVSEFKPVFEN